MSPATASGRVDARYSPAVLAFVSSRVLSIVTLLVAHSVHDGRVTADGLTVFDGGWYRFIARHWYGPQPATGRQTTWPFFPLLPGIGHSGLWVHVDPGIVMALVSNAATLVALIGVYRLVTASHGSKVATYAVWVTALFPASFVFSMAYPDALFLAASVWSFVMVREGRFELAGCFAAVASLSRPNGILVVVALAIAVLARRPLWDHRGAPSPGDARRPAPSLLRGLALTTGPAVVAVTAWCGWLWHRAGDPFIFLRAKSAWHEVTIVEALGHLRVHALPHVACAAAVIAALLIERRRLPVAWLTFAALWLLPPLTFGVVGMGRYANECFPAMVAIAVLIARFEARSARTWLAVSGGGLVVFSVLVAGSAYVP